MLASSGSAAGIPEESNAYTPKQVTNVSQNQIGDSTPYQHAGTERLDVTKIFQKNNSVYLRLAPEGAMDAPGPLILPKQMGDLYIKNANYLKGWNIQKYIRYVKYPSVQELRFDFYDKNQQYQGTATTTYWLP